MGNNYWKPFVKCGDIDVEKDLLSLDDWLAEDAKTVEEQISQVVNVSINSGLVEEHRETSVRLLPYFQCYFHSELLSSPLTEVEPLSKQLEKGVQPALGRIRMHASLMIHVMKEHVNKLLSAGFIYEKTDSR